MHVNAERAHRVLVTIFVVLVLADASDTGWHVATGRYVW
jgi:hypothetical protein